MIENGTGAASEALTGKKANRTTTTPKLAVQKKVLMQPTPNYKLGIEVGNTFTNFALLNIATGALYFEKTLTTYPEPIDGILNGINFLLETYKVSLAHVRTIVHGTTFLNHTMTARKGAKMAFITTKSFENVLNDDDELQDNLDNIVTTIPKALVSKKLCYGISERLDKTGHILEALNINELEFIVKEFVAQKVESIGICLQHSIVNPVHEYQIGDFLKRRFPKIYFSLSSEIAPDLDMEERIAVTTINAYLQPNASAYFDILEKKLERIDFKGIIHIGNASGYLKTLTEVRKYPIQLWNSEAAGGVMASAFISKILKIPRLWTFDMGGTSAKVALIQNGQPERIVKKQYHENFDLPTRLQMIDKIQVDIGGNSSVKVPIETPDLWIFEQNNPLSPVSPACFECGGEMPTVTDANLVLGFLDENHFLGGKMLLRKKLAINILEEKVAKPFGISVEAAAQIIHQIVQTKMTTIGQFKLLERNLDPRTVPMIAYGSMGTIHAFAVARALRVPQLIIPVGTGVMGALGLLVSPMVEEAIMRYIRPISNLNWQKINLFLHQAEIKSLSVLKRAHIAVAQSTIRRFAKMRYVNDDREIMVALPNETPLSVTSIPTIEQNFDAAYLLQYGVLMEKRVREMVALHVVVSSSVPNLPLKQVTYRTKHHSLAIKGHRSVYFEGNWVECRVYDRYALRAGDSLQSPALIEEAESTIFIGANSTIHLDRFENIIVNLQDNDE
jgi:N-methylhydantoinase A